MNFGKSVLGSLSFIIRGVELLILKTSSGNKLIVI